MFELLERGEVLEVPTERPLQEQQAWTSFRDVVLGLEYRKFVSLCRKKYSKNIEKSAKRSGTENLRNDPVQKIRK